ncbi:hypothetical protein MA16_Dca008203 [Dendrobium catenatum]|uniref:Uncharacterized protein n=1 Tax=Dendrobium catenatum TaxID=906689 RepID=A0A2I0XA53_9ASPA|nr:hypothetical protein MA16_Dca008203 [Dendrobium catenatum]
MFPADGTPENLPIRALFFEIELLWSLICFLPFSHLACFARRPLSLAVDRRRRRSPDVADGHRTLPTVTGLRRGSYLSWSRADGRSSSNGRSQIVGGMQHGRVYGLGSQAQAYEGMTSSTTSSFASSSHESLQAQQISGLQDELEQCFRIGLQVWKFDCWLGRKFFFNATGFWQILRRSRDGNDDTTNRIDLSDILCAPEIIGAFCGVCSAGDYRRMFVCHKPSVGYLWRTNGALSAGQSLEFTSDEVALLIRMPNRGIIFDVGSARSTGKTSNDIRHDIERMDNTTPMDDLVKGFLLYLLSNIFYPIANFRIPSSILEILKEFRGIINDEKVLLHGLSPASPITEVIPIRATSPPTAESLSLTRVHSPVNEPIPPKDDSCPPSPVGPVWVASPTHPDSSSNLESSQVVQLEANNNQLEQCIVTLEQSLFDLKEENFEFKEQIKKKDGFILQFFQDQFPAYFRTYKKEMAVGSSSSTTVSEKDATLCEEVDPSLLTGIAKRVQKRNDRKRKVVSIPFTTGNRKKKIKVNL